MRPIAYEVRKKTSMDIDPIRTRLREALAAERFGVLAEIDADAALREKLGLDVAADWTARACNPPPVAQALAVESGGGLLLRCNVHGRARRQAAVEPIAKEAGAGCLEGRRCVRDLKEGEC